MAENKLSWSELRRALAARAGVSEKEANAFLNAFQTQLVEALKQDKQVKVNGLGTFKLQAVAPRKSVNVTTGEEITIEGYNKIAFVPEAGVKELVESVQPSAISSQPSEIDPLQKLGTQAEEIVDILGELGQAPKKEKGEGKKAKGEGKKAKGEGKKAKVEPVAEPEPVVAPAVEPVVKPVVEPVAEPVVEPVVQPEPVVVEPTPAPEPEPQPVPKKPKKKYHFLRDTIICVVILLFLVLGGFFFLRHELSSWIDGLVKGAPEPTEVVTEEPAAEEPVAEEPIVEEAVTEEPAAVEEPVVAEKPAEVTKPAPKAANKPGKYSEYIVTEEITHGSRLAWIAKKHYGDKIYWPYLYDANRDRISNPSQIPVGTKIRVPKLSAAQRDTTSAAFKQLREEAYNAVH